MVTVHREIKIPMEPREHRQSENVASSCLIQHLTDYNSSCHYVFSKYVSGANQKKNRVVMYTVLHKQSCKSKCKNKKRSNQILRVTVRGTKFARKKKREIWPEEIYISALVVEWEFLRFKCVVTCWKMACKAEFLESYWQWNSIFERR